MRVRARHNIFCFQRYQYDRHRLPSEVAINTLSKIATENKLQLTTMIHNPLEGISFDNSYFDAIYSHMFFNMRFTEDQLKYLFIEVNRVLKIGGLNLFSVRSDNDAMYKKVRRRKKYLRHKWFPDSLLYKA